MECTQDQYHKNYVIKNIFSASRDLATAVEFRCSEVAEGVDVLKFSEGS